MQLACHVDRGNGKDDAISIAKRAGDKQRQHDQVPHVSCLVSAHASGRHKRVPGAISHRGDQTLQFFDFVWLKISKRRAHPSCRAAYSSEAGLYDRYIVTFAPASNRDIRHHGIPQHRRDRRPITAPNRSVKFVGELGNKVEDCGRIGRDTDLKIEKSKGFRRG
jgi:hypothetical protein